MKSPAQHLHTHNTHEEKEKTIFFCVCWTRHAKTQKSNSFIDFFFVFLSFTRWYFGHLCFDRILYGMSCVHVMTVFNLEQKRIELEQWTTPLKTEWKRKKQRTQTPAGSIFISVYMHTHNVCQFVRSEHKLSNFNHWNVLKMGSNGPNIYGSTIAQIVLALHFRLVCDYDLSSFFLLCNFFWPPPICLCRFIFIHSLSFRRCLAIGNLVNVVFFYLDANTQQKEQCLPFDMGY